MKSQPATKRSTAAPEFERRAARAQALARQTPIAQEPLVFAAGLYLVQGRVAESLADAHETEPLTGHLDVDADRFLDRISWVTRYAVEEGPPELAEQARARQEDIPATARARLVVYWAGDQTAAEDYLSRAILRPYVETLRLLQKAPDRVHRRGQCPFCGGAPWIGVRRDAGEMEGAKRLLGCGLCGVEFPFQRLLCPGCFEEDPHKLPVFQSEKHPGVRIEACETCRRYVKSIDLSEDARPIPEVDDVASWTMDLWAVEQGWARLEPGLAGL